MASDLLGRQRFTMTQSALTSSEGNSARFAADREADCPAHSVQTDSCECCQ